MTPVTKIKSQIATLTQAQADALARTPSPGAGGEGGGGSGGSGGAGQPQGNPVEWLRGFDKTYARHYWFNVLTEESRWDAPAAPWVDDHMQL